MRTDDGVGQDAVGGFGALDRECLFAACNGSLGLSESLAAVLGGAFRRGLIRKGRRAIGVWN